MTTHRAEAVPWAPRCRLGESPRWHAGRWWWIDADAGDVYRHSPGDGGVVETPWLSAGGRVSLVHPVTPTGMLVAVGTRLCVFDDSPNGPRARCDLADLDLPNGWLLNDGMGAPGGGLFIGVVSPDCGPQGYLQRIDAAGTLLGALPRVKLSNGLAYSSDHTLLYHADSARRQITAHQLADGGEIAASRIHLTFDRGLPDGIATDVAGYLWVALYGTGEVRRYRPDCVLDTTVAVEAPQVTAVALGGDDGRDMLITTAREGYDDARSAAEPSAGRLFATRAPAAGIPVMPIACGAAPIKGVG